MSEADKSYYVLCDRCEHCGYRWVSHVTCGNDRGGVVLFGGSKKEWLCPGCGTMKNLRHVPTHQKKVDRDVLVVWKERIC